MQLRSIGSLLRSVAAFALVATLLAARSNAAEIPGYAHYAELSLDVLLQLPQWARVAAEMRVEEAEVRDCLNTRNCRGPEIVEIAALISKLSTKDRQTQVERVHAFFNAKPYREDWEQFGRKDYWQSPLAFTANGGDCEDYAIAKYFALKLLGYGDDELRITVLVSPEQDEVHAVLAVDLDGQWVVLDNRASGLRRLASYDGWAPQYAVTEARAWRYVSESAPITVASVPARSFALPASR